MEKSSKKIEFYKVFGIEQGDVISFTGGGGKTSLIFSLAEELSEKGKVLITTTTKIFIPEKGSYNEKNIDVTGSGIDKESGKILGVTDDFILSSKEKYDYILIEADGSAQRGMKFWKEHDPVISKWSNKVIGIVNLYVMNMKIKDGIHRALEFCKKYNCDVERKITLELIREYLKNADFFKGYLGEKYLFINGVESFEKFNKALYLCNEITNELNSKYDKIMLGSLINNEVYQYKKIAAIILASGFSKRLGNDKLLLEFKGKTILQRTMELIDSINFSEKVIVTREDKKELEWLKDLVELENKLKLDDGLIIQSWRHYINEEASNGQSESIKISLKKVDDNSNLMFFVGDQPFLERDTILKLIKEYLKNPVVTLPKVGIDEFSPVIFPREYKSRLQEVNGDRGGKSVLNNHDIINKIEFLEANEFRDIDTKEDMEYLKNM